LFAVYGILSAIIAREKTGEGQFVGTSLFEAALGLSIWETVEFWGTGRSPKPLGTANRMAAPYQAFQASDAYFVLGAANQKLWLALIEAIDRRELNNDLRFATNQARLANTKDLVEELSPTFLTRTAEEWVDILLSAGVPAGPIYDYPQALASEHVAAREMVQDIAHPTEGSFKALGFAVKMSETPQQVRHPPPLLNEHADEIKKELVDLGLLDQAALTEAAVR
jgi:crotonobetainyl-CoA:carnitine CoA-transferase CaiB-like acyl-CoA transferase